MPKNFQRVAAPLLVASAILLSAILPCSGENPTVASLYPLITHQHATFAHSAGGRLAEVVLVHEYRSEVWRSTYAVKTAEGTHLLVTETTRLRDGSMESHTRFTDAESGYWVELVEDVPMPVARLSEITPEQFQDLSPRAGGSLVRTTRREEVRRGKDVPETDLQYPLDRPLAAVLKHDPPPPSWLESVGFLVTAVCPLARRELSESLCQKVDLFGRTLAAENSSSSGKVASWALTGHQYGSGAPAETSATARVLQEFGVVVDAQ